MVSRPTGNVGKQSDNHCQHGHPLHSVILKLLQGSSPRCQNESFWLSDTSCGQLSQCGCRSIRRSKINTLGWFWAPEKLFLATEPAGSQLFPLLQGVLEQLTPRTLPTLGLVEVRLLCRPRDWTLRSRPPRNCNLAAESCPAPAHSGSGTSQSQPVGTASAWSGLYLRSATV